MAFRPKKYDSGKVQLLPLAASTTVTKHQLLKFSSGYLIDAASGDNEVEFVALETVTAAATDGTTLCQVLKIDEVTLFEVLTDNTPVQATNVGNSYDLDSALQLDLDATTDKIFFIEKIINATDKLVEGHFNKPAIA